MSDEKYLVQVALTRDEYQLLCRALIKVEVDIKMECGQEALFWNKSNAGDIADIRARIRRGFTYAFGSRSFS